MVRAVRRGRCRGDRGCRHQPHDGAGCRGHRLGGNAVRALRVPGPLTASTTSITAASPRTTTSPTTTRASRCRRASSSISPTSTRRARRCGRRSSAYLDDLLSLGVAGFRIDAAKHMAADDVEAIVGALPDGTRIISEVIRGGGEPIQPEEYTGFGEVFEFTYARDLDPAGAAAPRSTIRISSDPRPEHVPDDIRGRVRRQPRHRARRGRPHLPRRRPLPDGERPDARRRLRHARRLLGLRVQRPRCRRPDRCRRTRDRRDVRGSGIRPRVALATATARACTRRPRSPGCWSGGGSPAQRRGCPASTRATPTGSSARGAR